jgi:phage shock protein C
MSNTPRRLYKSRRYKMIDGVCGGIAEYFDIDPTIVRVVFVLVTIMGGVGFIIYIAGMLLMPTNPDLSTIFQPVEAYAQRKSESKRFWGIALILGGALILLTNLGWFAAFDWWHVSWEVAFPIVLIGVGLWFMFVPSHRQQVFTTPPTAEGQTASDAAAQPVRKELRRSLIDRKLFGVCGGLAKYFNIDPTIVRILYVVLTIGSWGWGLLLYIILALLIPEEDITKLF